jgi:hypothetical protein
MSWCNRSPQRPAIRSCWVSWLRSGSCTAAVRARRAHAQDPLGGRRGGQRRTVTFAARPEEGFEFYPGSKWESALFLGGYQFLDPPPLITAEGAVPVGPSDGARKLDSRTNFFYMATGTTPAMCMWRPSSSASRWARSARSCSR